MLIKDIISLLRVKQWTKNIFIFSALFFTSNLFNTSMFFTVISGFLLFSLIASVGYIINDFFDLENDRKHPINQNRPLTSGKISKKSAIIIASSLSFISFVLAYFLNFSFLFVLILYLILSICYSVWFKQNAYLGIFVVSLFFVIRVYAGAVLLGFFASWYLLTLTFLLALFLVSGKRLHNLNLLKRSNNVKYFNYIFQACFWLIILLWIVYIEHLMFDKNFNAPFSLFLSLFFVYFGLYRFKILLQSKTDKLRSFDQLVFDKLIIGAIALWILTLIIPFYVGK